MTLQESVFYYRSRLSYSAKLIYDSLYFELQKNMDALSYQFVIPYKCSTADCSAAYKALTLDRPELYALQYGVTIGISGKSVRIKKNKCISKDAAFFINKELQDCISEITRGLHGRTEFEKEFIIYTRLTKKLAYGSKEMSTHSILAPVLMSRGSCDGRSKLMALCLRAVGVPCIVAREDGHMWNMASIDGHNVWLDCTYETVKNDRLAYFYFNLDDKQMKIDHELDGQLPHCSDCGYDFFSKFGLTFRTRQEVKNYIHAEYRDGADTISFKLEGADEQTLKFVMQDCLPVESNGCSYSLNQSGNAVIITFRNREKAFV